MAQNSDRRRSDRFPLWVIAISLLVIAVCLVLDLVQRRLDVQKSEHSPAPTARDRLVQGNARRQSVSRTSHRPTPVTETASDEAAVPAPTQPWAPADSELATGVQLVSETQIGGIAPIAGAGRSNEVGEIVGKVLLHGHPPPEQRIDLSRDPSCAQAHPEPLMTRFFVVSTNGGLADVGVSLNGVHANFSTPTSAVTLQFTNCQIEPYVSAAMKGQRIRFENGDGRRHRIVFDFPSWTKPFPPGGVRLPNGTVQVSVNLIPNSELQQAVWLLNSTNFFKIQCVIHPSETAYVHVLDNPYFAITDTNGEFRISNVPAGNYVLAALHQKATGTNSIKTSVTVAAGRITAANIILNAPNH